MKFRSLANSLVLAAALAVGVRTAAQQAAGSPPSDEPPLRLSPTEIELYKRAKTLIDWTPQRIESIPLLHKLHPAENQDELPAILERVGKTAVALYHDFPKIACDEEVYSETSLKNPIAPGGGMGRNDTVRQFRYIIIPKLAGDIPAFDEYRTDTKGRPVDIARLANLKMITSKFTSTWTYFSPSELPDSRFRYLGTQSIQRRECYVVGFAQKPEARSVSGFRVGDDAAAAALLVQGFAWIDEQSFEILKIETWLLARRTDIGLDAEYTIVNHSPVRPAGFDRVLWLPHDVTVTILYRGAYFRNTHRYSKFKLFRVESTIKPVE